MGRIGAVTIPAQASDASATPARSRLFRGRAAYVPAAFLIGAFYFIAGKLGLEVAFVHASASPVWAPTGLAIAACLVVGYAMWPAIFVGAFLVNVTTEGTVWTSLGIAAGNTLEAVVGAFLANRFAAGADAFATPWNAVKFAFLAGLVGTIVSPTFGVVSLALGGFAAWTDFSPIWITWWLGDVGGAIIVAPFLIIWAKYLRGQARRRRWEGIRVAEAGALAASIMTVSYVLFLGGIPDRLGSSPFMVLVLPLVAWAAFRFEQRGASAVTVALAAVAIGGTLAGHGPFVVASENESLLLLQTFMGTVSVTSLVLAGVVAERRGIEESLVRARDELDRRVRERTLDLERAVEELQSFSYAVSHDLRGPLRVIDGYTHELLETHGDTLDEAGRRSLGYLQQGSRRMAHLIDSLLRLTRLSRSELRTERVDVSAIARTIEATLRAQEPDRRVEFRIQDGMEVQGDPSMMQVLLENLLGNAWKFSKDRDLAHIYFERSPAAPPDTYFVQDDGAGFDPAHADKLFQPFSRLHTESEFEGTGIGLVVAQKIVRRHGGRIWADAAPDRGATFFFTLGESGGPR